MLIGCVTAKLGKMRKAVEWTVYPRLRPGSDVIIQSDRRICRFNPETGEGSLSASHRFPGFIALTLPGVERIIVPEDVRKAVLAAEASWDKQLAP